MTIPRPRLVQTAQKGNSCFYSALNRIRFHPDKTSSRDSLKQRRKEANYALDYHKKCLDIEEQHLWKCDLAHSATEHFGSITKKVAKKLLRGDYKLLKEADLEQFRVLLEEFTNEPKYADLLTFARSTLWKTQIDHNTEFMKTFKLDPKDNYEKFHRGLLKKSWTRLSLFQKQWSTGCTSNLLLMTLFRCQKSTWHPSYPIKHLIQQIDLHGPHVINGHFGQVHYAEPPFQLSEQIGNRAVFGWHPNAKRIKENVMCHAIVVVGARSDKELVYFTDPLDVSDPEKPEPVYVMSYKRIKESIFDLDSVYKRSDENDCVVDCRDGRNNYASYADQALARL
jgi:hypothetical protein